MYRYKHIYIFIYIYIYLYIYIYIYYIYTAVVCITFLEFRFADSSVSFLFVFTITAFYSNYYLEIIIQCNLKITNYLDTTINLKNGSYHPYRKANEETSYIHIILGHPPSMIKESPRSTEKRLDFVTI